MEDNYNNLSAEKDFLATYRQSDYERPSDAVDMVVFTIKKEEVPDFRRLSRKNLSLLLIKRGEFPFKDCWALPGGFVRKGETLEEAAYRELKEEAGVDNVYLSQLHNFSKPDRDPRGWIISNAFLTLAEESLFHLQSGSDASDAKWFSVTYDEIGFEVEATTHGKISKRRYQLKLTHKDEVLRAIIELRTQYESCRIKHELIVIESQGLAFDHAEIIGYGINHLRKTLNDSLIAFELMPEYFTLTDLQQVYETILGTELLPSNFRRKIADYVMETEERIEGVGYRPSKLFKRNLDKLF